MLIFLRPTDDYSMRNVAISRSDTNRVVPFSDPFFIRITVCFYVCVCVRDCKTVALCVRIFIVFLFWLVV